MCFFGQRKFAVIKVYFLFLILIIIYGLRVTWARNISIGLFVPWTGTWPRGKNLASAALIAIDDINKSPTLLQNETLQFYWRDDKCDAQVSVGETALFNNNMYGGRKGVDVYIGPYCSDGCIPSGLLAAFFDKPMISYSCSAKKLSSKVLYPTFARTATFARTHAAKLTAKLASLMKKFDWKLITLIVSNQPGWYEFGQHVFEKLTTFDIKARDRLTYMKDAESYKEDLEKAKKTARSKFLIFLLLLS